MRFGSHETYTMSMCVELLGYCAFVTASLQSFVSTFAVLLFALTVNCFVSLFHRRTRASYVYNGCLAWYNVVLTHGSTQA